VENVVMMCNHAGFSLRVPLLAQAAFFTMHYFYGSTYSCINDTVTSLGNYISITQ